MTRYIDLNCDMGEGFGAWRMGDDESMMAFVTSVNIACGFHAGDPRIMDQRVYEAKQRGLGIGAHPAFPDLVGFGRRNLAVSYREAFTDVLYQLGALSAFCQRHGVRLQHVKPHGQLNNLAMADTTLAEAIVDAVLAFDAGLILIAYGGELMRLGREKGLTVAFEVYADRAYAADGRLVPRRVPGAVISEPSKVRDRVVRMVTEGTVETIEGQRLAVQADTVCLHGDTPDSVRLAETVREALEQAGVTLRPLGAWLDSKDGTSS
ncbi:MAG: LamB/YcsF family protein [Firmicutes bacterium]|nr:LamB/YcsF family protein [Bacillota bacterium]